MAPLLSAAGVGGTLTAQHVHPKPPARVRSVRLPKLGRVYFSSDPGDGRMFARSSMESRLHAVHYRRGAIHDVYDLGSGNIQQNFVNGLSQDQQGTAINKAAPLLATADTRMYSGTGASVNTFDFQLATTAGPASGAIVPTLGFSADNATMVYTGTIAYAGGLAITEWGLFTTNVQGSQTNCSTNTFTTSTITGNTWNTTLGLNAYAGYIAVVTGTPVGAFILSNTAGTGGVLTVGGFYNLTVGGGGATTPSSNTAVNIYPLMSDHKTFSAINVVSGDSITFTYTRTYQSGG